MKPTLLILAAGMGSRYGKLKQIDPVGPGGEVIMDYSIFDAIRSGFGKIVFIIRKDFSEEFKNIFSPKLSGKIEVEYVYQELEDVPDGIRFSGERQKPWGTGHAMLSARNVINEPFAVINADDFYGPSAYKSMADFLTVNVNDPDLYAMIGYRLDTTLSEYGSVARGVCQTDREGFLQNVVERTSIERDSSGDIYFDDRGKKVILTGSEIVSMNYWGFTTSVFGYMEKEFVDFIKKNASDPKAEFYIPTVANKLINEGKVRLKVLESVDKWFGVTYSEDKPLAVKNINRLIEQGVYPAKLWT